MNILTKLNYDCIGIIYDFLSDDFDMFMYIRANNLSPQKRLRVDNLNWREISKRDDLPYEFIDEYFDLFDWEILTKNNIHDIKFITEYKDLIRWDTISNNMSFCGFSDYTLFREFSDRLDWKKISRWRHMCELFVDEFADKLDWEDMTVFQCLTDYIINKHSSKINWGRISFNHFMKKKVINKHKYVHDNLDECELRQFLKNTNDQSVDIGI